MANVTFLVANVIFFSGRNDIFDLLGCARFADLCANSWRLDCFSHSNTMEV